MGFLHSTLIFLRSSNERNFKTPKSLKSPLQLSDFEVHNILLAGRFSFSQQILKVVAFAIVEAFLQCEVAAAVRLRGE